MQEAEWNLIEGTVEAVIYQNRENGYTVLRLDAGESGGVTVVGCLPGVAPGERITVRGPGCAMPPMESSSRRRRWSGACRRREGHF